MPNEHPHQEIQSENPRWNEDIDTIFGTRLHKSKPVMIHNDFLAFFSWGGCTAVIWDVRLPWRTGKRIESIMCLNTARNVGWMIIDFGSDHWLARIESQCADILVNLVHLSHSCVMLMMTIRLAEEKKNSEKLYSHAVIVNPWCTR